MEEKIIFTDDNGEDIEFYVLEETRINNVNYILVTDSQDEEATAYILKDVSDDKDEEAVYEMVEDDAEIEYIGKIFAELLDDVELS